MSDKKSIIPEKWTPAFALGIWFVLSSIVAVILALQFIFDNQHELEKNDQTNQQEVIKILLDQDQDYDKLYNLTLDIDKWMRDLEEQVASNSLAIKDNQKSIQDILMIIENNE